MMNRRENGNRIAKPVAELADYKMRRTLKSSGFSKIDEKDRVTTIKDSIKSYKNNMNDYTNLFDNAVGNMKRVKLPTR